MFITVAIVSIGMAASVGGFILLRRGWLALHDMAGIRPGALPHHPPHPPIRQSLQPSAPTAINQWQWRQLSDELLPVIQQLPEAQQQQIQRIDDKADAYQQWQADLAQQFTDTTQVSHPIPQPQWRELPSSEEQFVLRKLLNEHLPQALQSYHTILKQQQRSGYHLSASASSDHSHISSMDAAQSALSVLIALLDDIERRIDERLWACEQQQLQDLAVLQRYVNSRGL